MGLFSSKASASSNTSVSDSKTQATDNAVIYRGVNAVSDNARMFAKNSNSTFNVGSDDVAISAIEAGHESARDALRSTSESFSDGLAQFFSASSKKDNQVQANTKAVLDIAGNLINEKSVSDEGRFANLLKMGLISSVAIVFLVNGGFKGVFK